MSNCGLCKEKEAVVRMGVKHGDFRFKKDVCDECLLSVASQIFDKEGGNE